MSRWRPPPPDSTPIITAAGLQALQQELDHLWRTRRPDVVRALSAAAAEGDRSENAEYQYRKKELAGIDRRVRYLGKRIPRLHVGPASPPRADRIHFGARVELECQQSGTLRMWRIVGPDETEAAREHISIDAPMARALLGHAVGDTVRVDVPAGSQCLKVIDITYPGTR